MTVNKARIETLVNDHVNHVVAGGKIEDSLVEAKSEWPAPEKATQLAALANAAYGQPVMLIIGLSEDNHEVVLLDDTDISTWWAQVEKRFAFNTAPRLTDLVFHTDHGTVVCLYFETDQPPYMIKTPNTPTVISSEGATPMLTAKDIRLERMSSRRGEAGVAGAVVVRAGDIAVAGRAVRICAEAGTLLGPGIGLVRADPKTLDPGFLAGILRAAAEHEPDSDIDLHTVAIPRLPATEQRRYAAEFARLRKLEADWQARCNDIEQLVRLGYRGLATGRLRPAVGE